MTPGTTRRIRLAAVALVGAGLTVLLVVRSPLIGGSPTQVIPVTWDEDALVEYEVPPPDPTMHPEFISAEYYYGIPERVIHQTYPVYHPDVQPDGYIDSLAALGPRSMLDTDTLETEDDWLRAGELVFDSPQLFFPLNVGGPVQAFLAPALAAAGLPAAPDGTFPWVRYVVTEAGVMMGVASCANCHTRLMPDGSVVKGAQGNYDFDGLMARLPGAAGPQLGPNLVRAITHEQFAAPWIDHGSQDVLRTITPEQDSVFRSGIPPGVQTRQGTNYAYPARVPDLRGVRHQKYLDATGLVRHRGIGDLMRYAAFNQFADHLTRYGDFIPSLGVGRGTTLPPPDQVQSPFHGPYSRFTDAQAYALALYLYDLEPVPSPHTFDDETMALGERVFIEEGCVTCHSPPHYTNNTLTPALGFTPPDDHYERFDLFDVSVETDPGLALYTRRGTGYYKVPSLRGLWYRSPLLHDGSITTLEELLDPARLRDDWVRTGFKPYGVGRAAVPGHPFGLELDEASKAALISYLLTL